MSEVSAFLAAGFPHATSASVGEVIALAPGTLRMRLDPVETMLRPGRLVSGPTQMALVDVAAYAVIAAHHGPEAMAVTHALSINFLRGCQFAPLFADATIMKLGRRLATIDVRLWQGDEATLIAQASVGYALPQ